MGRFLGCFATPLAPWSFQGRIECHPQPLSNRSWESTKCVAYCLRGEYTGAIGLRMSEPSSKKSDKKKKRVKLSKEGAVTAQQPKTSLKISNGAVESSLDERRYSKIAFLNWHAVQGCLMLVARLHSTTPSSQSRLSFSITSRIEPSSTPRCADTLT